MSRGVRGWRDRRALALVAVSSVLLSGALAITPTNPASAVAGPGSTVVTASVTATRTHLVAGADDPVDTRHVELKVSTTQDLRDQQSINVTWTGAHPSSNASADPNSDVGYQTEYPMVLLQCRGTAATVSPQTCWAPFYGSRSQLNGQGSDNRNVDVGEYPAWRLDRYAAPADRARFAQEPSPARPSCPNATNAAEHRLPFLAADGTAYYGSGGFADAACGAAPPEAASFTGGDTTVTNLPDNSTFVATHTDGAGSTSFNVRDAQTNASLGCSSTVACSLVAIPVMGISCDGGAGLPAADRPEDTPADPTLVADAEAECEASNFFDAGSLHVASPGNNYAVSGGLWWSASNWRNRITVPLGFAPPSNVCELVSKKSPVNIYGSELLIQATTQWSASFCLDPTKTPFRHVQYSDTQSRNLLTQTLSSAKPPEGSAEAIFDSYPPTSPYPRPVAHAPIAATAFAISYAVDDEAGHSYAQLKLTPRLLAKLLTESYTVNEDLQQRYRYNADYYGLVNPMRNNPLNITFDPEFIALNPGIESNSSADAGARAALIGVGTSSDVMYALTSYINADPEARAWLDGTPDPWGMQVNPNYRGISLPVSTMPLLDTFAYPEGYGADGTCTADLPPVPFLPLADAPIARLADIAQAVQYAVPGAQTRCSITASQDGVNNFYQWTRAQRQAVGSRFVLGVTSLGDARRYGLATAALQTSSTVKPTAKYTSSQGRTFAVPTDASLRAAGSTLKFADDSAGWPVSYTALQNVPTAYPGTMIVYLDVPTTGLPPADAKAYAAVLTFLAGPGQQPGEKSGQLPAGYLPLTAPNGLSSLAAYTAKAAGLVAAQKSSSVIAPVDAAGPTGPDASTPAVAAGPEPSVESSSGAPGAGPSNPATSAAAAPTPTAASPALKSLGTTSRLSNTIAKNLVLLLLVLLLVGPLAVPVLLIAARRRGSR